MTAERDAERIERRRDSSSQSDLGAISCLVSCMRGRWFKVSQRPRTSHVGMCWLRQWPHGPVKRRDTSQARRKKMPTFCGESPKTHKWVQAAALPRKGVTYPNRCLRKSSRTDCLSQVTSGGGDALAAKKSHNIEVAAEQRTGGDSQANRFGIHTLREVKATIRTLKKLVQLFHSSVNIVRGRADRRNSMETARCETTHVIIFRVLQCWSGHTPAFES